MLLNDSERMKAYRQAVFKTVRPGDVVLDIGTGSGILALFACQAGAKRVYAVDRGDMIILARELAEANGFADRVVFQKKEIKQIQLDEQVDVITSELIAKSVLGQDMADLVGWCRDRFLKPGGRILPQKVELRVAPVESDKIYQEAKPPEVSMYEVSFAPLAQLTINKPASARIPVGALLAEEQTAYTYHALTAENSDRFDATLIFQPARNGILHGFAAWFSTLLAEGVELTNRPPGTTCWDNLFFPTAGPVQLKPGMIIELEIRGRSDSQIQDFWIWNTTARKSEHILAQHRQSSFAGRILSAETLRKASDSWAPVANLQGKIARLTLNLMDQGISLREIADRIKHELPGCFETIEDVLGHVRKIALQYGD